jgi:quercetin dioxygenase-like cupin family protein
MSFGPPVAYDFHPLLLRQLRTASENALKKILLVIASVCLVTPAAQADVGSSDLVKWSPAPPSLPKGAQAAVLSGDPTKAGLFTMRLKFPPGYTVAPHHHPADELTTVLSGELSRGVGNTVDRVKATHLTAGGYGVVKAGMNHYVFTRSGVIEQVTGIGPWQVIYANRKDDPRKR